MAWVRASEPVAAGSLACYVLRMYLHPPDLSIHSQYKMAEENKTSVVQLRISPSLKAAAQKAASDDQRSLTSLIEKLLTDFLKKNGYLEK